MLIGLSYIYPDPLIYMLDVEEVLPILNVKGDICGSMQVSIRCWINKMEVAPAYLSTDKECRLDDFVNENLVIKFHFESLHDLPKELCAHNKIRFQFFYHTSLYTTPETSGVTKSPTLGEPIIIEQLITADLIDYLQRGYIEIEVWGKKVNRLSEMRDCCGLTEFEDDNEKSSPVEQHDKVQTTNEFMKSRT